MTPVQATVALLQSWLDYWPHPAIWTGELQRRSVPRKGDPKQLGYVRCDQCGGEGCRACWFKGSFIGDPYLAERGLVPSTLSSHARFVDCDVCGGWGRVCADSNARPSNDHPLCDRCFGMGKVPGLAGGIIRFNETIAGEKVRTGDSTLDALSDGDSKRTGLRIYRDHLLPGLDELARLDRYGHFLVEWVWVMGAQSPRSLPARGTVRLVNATRTLAAGMPEGFERRLPPEIKAQVDHRLASLVRAKGKTADRFAQRARDEEIRLAHRRGASLDELAERFRLDKSRISRITRRVA